MGRLPSVGSDDGVWGTVLNDYLLMVHNPDGTLKNDVIAESKLDNSVRTKLNAVGSGSSGAVASVNTRTGIVTLTQSDVGLANVNNTSDASKPISTATQAALDSKAAVSHTHTSAQISDSTTTGRAIVVAADASAVRSAIGLANVDNTSDASKPVSTATQAALDAKAATSHTHTTSQISDSTTIGRTVVTAVDAAAVRSAIGAGTSSLTLGTTSGTAKAGDYVPTKSDVGLANVDNTSDINKPVSSATQSALNTKAAISHTHTANQISDSTTIGRTIVTATDAAAVRTAISLANVDNTSDVNKPISSAVQTALNAKADASSVSAKVLLIANAGALPAGTPAGVIVVVKA